MPRRSVPEDVRIAGRISRATGGLSVYVKRCLFPYPDGYWYATARQREAVPARHGARGKTPRAALVNLLALVQRSNQETDS